MNNVLVAVLLFAVLFWIHAPWWAYLLLILAVLV